MALRKISFGLSPDAIKDAVDYLETYKKWVNQKIDELMVRLAAVGLSTARVYFQQGATEGNEAPETWVEPIENGFKIFAKGHDVFFIEFGAGDAAGNHPDAEKAPVDTSPGSYSIKNTQEMPMYHSMREIERNVTKIAKEVFS